MNTGWVKLWRQIEDSQVWQNPHLLHAWMYCLLEANHAPKWVPVHGLTKPVRVGVGQFITGRFSLHAGLYPKKKKSNPCAKTTWRWLETLANMQNLSVETSSRYSLVTIHNYERYQSNRGEDVQVDVQPVSSRCPAGVQPVSTTKNDKNDKNEENEEKKQPPAGFVRFWNAWPKHHRKTSKKTCLAKWVKDDLEDKTDHIIAMLEAKKASGIWTARDSKGPPAPLVYLNQSRYDGDVADITTPTSRPTQTPHPVNLDEL